MLKDIISYATKWNKYVFQDLPDKRVKHWPLLGDPLLVSLLTGAWLWFVLVKGPRVMRYRKPFHLSKFIQTVNVVQVVANLYVAYEFLAAGWLHGYAFVCQPCETSTSPEGMRMAKAVYIYFLLKILDMVDTVRCLLLKRLIAMQLFDAVIYVLRRKPNQITFLHMYHHLTTLMLAWIIANYAPGGHGTFVQLLNAIVHVLMYSYYFLAALGPQYQKYIWWKKYLTRIQLCQFLVQFAQTVLAMNKPKCQYPYPIVVIFLPIIVIMFVLFMNFYVRAYWHRDFARSSKKKEH